MIIDRGADAAPSPDEVSSRLHRFELTREPSALWPGLTERNRVAAAREIERVTRGMLAGASGLCVDPAGEFDHYALAIAAHTTGMGPLLGRWLLDGAIDAAPALQLRFRTQLENSRARHTRIAREVSPALDALAACAPTLVALRGFHTARSYFDEPGVRRMADVDVLVAPEFIAAAEAALRTVGFRPAGEALRPYKRDWLPPGAEPRIFSVELDDSRNRWSLELHASHDRVIHPGAVARLDGERECIELVEFEGRELSVLRQPLLAISLACHCSQELGSSRLLRLYELVRVIRADHSAGRLDWDELLAMLTRTGAARFAWPAFALAEELAPGTVDARVLAIGKRASTWAARRTVARLVPAGGSLDKSGALRQSMWTRSPVSLLQRALRMVWPASFTRPQDVLTGWRVRLRRIRAGLMSFDAPDERVIPRQ
jgi:Uncharacterised nucleotidyltransferase